MATIRLTASGQPATVDVDARTIRGMVVPWNVQGNTSMGRIGFRPGSITYPDASVIDRVKLTREHDRSAPRGYGASLAASDTGLEMSFHIPQTAEGDQALAEAAHHLRDGLSVDVDDVVIRGGWVDSARLVAVGQVSVPAFDDARIAASDTPSEDTPEDTPDDAPGEDAPGEGTETENQESTRPAEPAQETESAVPETATVPANLRAAHAAPAGRGVQGIQTMQQLYAALAERAAGRAPAELRAALADITHTANSIVQATQYEGELWNGVAYQRIVIPFLSQKSLTSYKVQGWRWKVAPVVAPWTGDKTAVPSNPAETEPVEQTAERLAGAHDIDRKFRDFGDSGFFESYYSAMAESYAQLSDEAALADLLAAAGTFTWGTGSAWTNILTMALDVQDAKHTGATFAFVGRNIATDLASTVAQDAPAFLDLLGGLPTIRYVPQMDPDGTVVGIGKGATFYELPGVPIRVEAVDMVKGGIDAGVFGYYSTIVNAPTAFLKSDSTPTP